MPHSSDPRETTIQPPAGQRGGHRGTMLPSAARQPETALTAGCASGRSHIRGRFPADRLGWGEASEPARTRSPPLPCCPAERWHGPDTMRTADQRDAPLTPEPAAKHCPPRLLAAGQSFPPAAVRNQVRRWPVSGGRIRHSIPAGLDPLSRNFHVPADATAERRGCPAGCAIGRFFRTMAHNEDYEREQRTIGQDFDAIPAAQVPAAAWQPEWARVVLRPLQCR